MTLLIPRDAAPGVGDAVLASRVTVVQGPPGSGKTVLLDQVAAYLGDRAVVIRVPLAIVHNAPPAFRAHLGGATRAKLGAPGWVGGEEISPADLGEYLGALENRPEPERPVCILFDDLHLIHQAQVLGVLEAALTMLPADVHVLIASRARPPLLLAQHRSAGGLSEFGPETLAFTEDELSALGSAAEIDRVLALTAGWVLPTVVLLGSGAGDRAVNDFLAEEVFVALAPEQERVLEDTSSMESFTADALDGVDFAVETVIDQLDQRSLVQRSSAGRWMVPPVARDWLRTRLLAKDPARAALALERGRTSGSPLATLSDREREVLDLLDSELTVMEIATHLHMSYHTAKTHIRSIYSKLGVSSRMAAVRAARS